MTNAAVVTKIKKKQDVLDLAETTMPFFIADQDLLNTYHSLSDWHVHHGLGKEPLKKVCTKLNSILGATPSYKTKSDDDDLIDAVWGLELSICNRVVQFLICLSKEGLQVQITPDKSYCEFIIQHLCI